MEHVWMNCNTRHSDHTGGGSSGAHTSSSQVDALYGLVSYINAYGLLL